MDIRFINLKLVTNLRAMVHVHVPTCTMYTCMLSISSSPHVHAGSDVTVVGYGAQIQILRNACDMAQEELGVSCELIDLRTILPWDEETLIKVLRRVLSPVAVHSTCTR